MFRCLTVLKILAIFFTLSVCHADEAYDQSYIDEINKILATQICKPECTFALPSLSQLGNLGKATLKSLNFDVNSDGAPDYILESPANCGSSGCLKAILVSSNGKLGKVLEGRNIDQLSQDKNAIQKAYKNFRKPISNNVDNTATDGPLQFDQAYLTAIENYQTTIEILFNTKKNPSGPLSSEENWARLRAQIRSALDELKSLTQQNPPKMFQQISLYEYSYDRSKRNRYHKNWIVRLLPWFGFTITDVRTALQPFIESEDYHLRTEAEQLLDSVERGNIFIATEEGREKAEKSLISIIGPVESAKSPVKLARFSGPGTLQIPQNIIGTDTANSTPSKDYTEPASTNICGSDVSKYLVPDFVCFDARGGQVPYENCASNRSGGTLVRQRVDFTSACSNHDACYGNKGANKSNCDAIFYEDLKQACRTQVGGIGADRIMRACIDTALQFNDVVRGQETRRFGLWMVQQVPFTGQSGCDAFVAAQRRAGVTEPSCTTSATPGPDLIGRWHDGGPGCASIRKEDSSRHFVLRAWYCEASESKAKPVVVEHDATVNAYVHELTGLSLKMLPSGQLEILAKGNIRDRLGEGTFLADEVSVFERE
jgi:hypothetical protein